MLFSSKISTHPRRIERLTWFRPQRGRKGDPPNYKKAGKKGSCLGRAAFHHGGKKNTHRTGLEPHQKIQHRVKKRSASRSPDGSWNPGEKGGRRTGEVNGMEIRKNYEKGRFKFTKKHIVGLKMTEDPATSACCRACVKNFLRGKCKR